jgi:outer membrane biosynthesis protein TonB
MPGTRTPTTPPEPRQPLVEDGRLTARAWRIIALAPPLLLAAALAGGGIGWAGGTVLNNRQIDSVAATAHDATQAPAGKAERKRPSEPAPADAVADTNDPRPAANRGGKAADRDPAEPTEEPTEEPTDAATEQPDDESAPEPAEEPAEAGDDDAAPTAPDEPADTSDDDTNATDGSSSSATDDTKSGAETAGSDPETATGG